jgi:hypothetical protein
VKGKGASSVGSGSGRRQEYVVVETIAATGISIAGHSAFRVLNTEGRVAQIRMDAFGRQVSNG